jgi:hypothetical protein
MGGLSEVARRAGLGALSMPTVLRWHGFRFYFFSNEGTEPRHIHVDKGENSVKFWLEPVLMARNFGFSQAELAVIEGKVREEQAKLVEAWNGYFNRNS